jgi:hypothetical protein
VRGAVASRRILRAGLALAACVGSVLLTGCASRVDRVDPNAYLRQGGGWYRIASPYANQTVPPAAVFPESCKSPPSVMGGPENC